MNQDDPERVLYLAINDEVYEGIFSEPLGQILRGRPRDAGYDETARVGRAGKVI